MPPVLARPLRWLIVAPLSPSPTGRRIGVSGERFTAVMASLPLALSVTVPDRIGDAGTRTVKLHPQRPRDFRTREILAQVELLGALSGLADSVQEGGALKSCIGKVRALVGDGPLCETLELMMALSAAEGAASERTARPTPRSTPPSAARDASADENDPIFGKASVGNAGHVTPHEAKSAVGSFISAVRSNAASAKKKPMGSSPAAEAIRVAVQTTAHEILATEPVAGLERAWRSLRMIIAAAPRPDDLSVDALDVGADGMVEALADCLDKDEPFSRPDAIFIIEPVDDPAVLSALATTADKARVPVVVQVSGPTVGLDEGEQDPRAIPEAWQALRAHPSAGWLCAVLGEPVLANETDAGTRVVTGGGAAALAAMASASVGTTAAPGDIVGKRGALVAPAAHEVEIRAGRHTIPTRTFVTYRTQTALAARGVTALGSEIDSDQLRLAAAPMVAGSMALPDRILAGRAHRLAVEVRRQLGGSATTAELARALDDAAGAFLPRISVGDVTLRVSDADSPDGIAVDASIGAAVAGATVTFSVKD